MPPADPNLALEFLGPHTGMILAASIVALIILAVGRRDILRFSLIRTWAISSVCFRQAIRRRILWITPVVMLGVIAASQLARPADEQDDIRQTLKFCLFATGLLVTLVTIILAATNLPKEIETRVIYTIATKPATRLEIIVGKVLGFARISGAVLLIMAVFTLAYLHVRQWQLRRLIVQKLNTPGAVDSVHRPTLEFYHADGLLHAREFAAPADDDLQVYAKLPTGDHDRWVCAGEQEIIIPIPNFAQGFSEWAAPEPVLLPRIDVNAVTINIAVRARPAPVAGQPTTVPTGKPRFNVSIMAENFRTLLTPEMIGPENGHTIENPSDTSSTPIPVIIPGKYLAQLGQYGPKLFLSIVGLTPQWQFATDSPPVKIIVPRSNKAITALAPPACRGRFDIYGQQLRGVADFDQAPVAVYTFSNTAMHANNGTVSFEFRPSIERSGGNIDYISDAATKVRLTFRNLANAAAPEFIATVFPESNRSVYVQVPYALVQGGSFAVEVRSLTSGHWLKLRTGPKASLRAIHVNESFVFNLAKSMSVIWLLSLLVAIAAIFCSTFVSWPIAVVMTGVILLGHWGVMQIGFQPNMGRSIVQDIFGRGLSPDKQTAMADTITALNSAVGGLARLLPDISQFESTDHLIAGTAIPLTVLLNAAKVAFGFGLPLMCLAYLLLQFKEVAP